MREGEDGGARDAVDEGGVVGDGGEDEGLEAAAGDAGGDEGGELGWGGGALDGGFGEVGAGGECYLCCWGEV